MGDMYDGESMEATAYAVLCPIHGRVFLREAEYDRQMDRPDSFWACPRMDSDPKRFGLCGMRSEFDDATYEAAQPAYEEEPEPACAKCGSELEWIDCDTCGCTGFDGHECGEDTCCCAEPEDNRQCGTCEGNGGWSLCPNRTRADHATPTPQEKGGPR